MTKILAILPAYNEEIAIGSIILNTKRHVDRVVVVDDGSTDNTVKIAQLAGAEVIKHDSNKGKGAALKTGFNLIKDCDIIVTMDTDGQHNPDEIPKLIMPILSGKADIVNGSRYLNGNEKNTPGYRRIGQTVLDKATNLGGEINITDSQSGFRAFSRRAISIFRFNTEGFGIESEMMIEAANKGLKIKEVEIGVRYDVDGSTKNPVSHGFKVLMNILNDIEFHRPLFYFTLPGIVISTIGLIFGLIFFSDYLSHSVTINSVPSAAKSLLPAVLALMLFAIGGFLALTGIILDSMSKMINRILHGVSHNPSINKSNTNEIIFKPEGQKDSPVKDSK